MPLATPMNDVFRLAAHSDFTDKDIPGVYIAVELLPRETSCVETFQELLTSLRNRAHDAGPPSVESKLTLQVSLTKSQERIANREDIAPFLCYIRNAVWWCVFVLIRETMVYLQCFINLGSWSGTDPWRHIITFKV